MTPLVLLHPLGSDRGFFDEIGADLGEVRTIALDLPGHGVAPLADVGSTFDDVAALVVRHLDEQADLPAGRFSVAGISLGGLVAQHLAARHPERIDRLVLIDTVSSYPEDFRLNWAERARVARADGLAGLFPAMETMWFTQAFRDANPEVVAKVRQRFLTTSVEGYARACDMLQHADATAVVADIAAPTLIVCGSQDAPAFLEATAWLAQSLPDARVQWIDGKHAAVLEQRDVFAAALKDFLR